MEKQYISIKEFAQCVGVSQQAIYKQLNKKLKNHIKEVEGKKYIDKSAIDLFKKENKTTNIEQQFINLLQEELKEKNELIRALEERLEYEQQLLKHEQELVDQAHKFLALEKQKVLELECKLAEPEEPKKKKWKFWK